MFRWLEKKRKQKEKQSRLEAKRKDYMRPVRVTERLKLRADQAADDGDLERCKTMIRRMRRVRDYQIRVWGH